VLSAWSSTGWEAVFGALDSGDALAALPEQLAVLAALKGRLDFMHPSFGYVDLENPAAPAIGGKPGEPATVKSALAGSMLPSTPPAAIGTPAAAASPTPATVATPTAGPSGSPTAAATPTPVVFNVAPPSPSAHG
jgi:hypothetical protein